MTARLKLKASRSKLQEAFTNRWKKYGFISLLLVRYHKHLKVSKIERRLTLQAAVATWCFRYRAHNMHGFRSDTHLQ